jgi:hypothetical protein
MSVTKVQLVGNVSPGAVFAGIVTATSLSVGNAVGINSTGINVTGIISATSLSVAGQTVSSLGVGINTEGGSVGTGATVLDFRGAGISTVTVASGIGTIFIEGGGGGGASVTTSDTAPSTPTDGDLWYDSVGGRLYVYYDDGNTNQWVDAAPQGGGDAGFSKLEVGNTKAEVTDTGSNGTFTVTTEGTSRFTVGSTGNVSIANGNLVFATAGTGIDFSATANSSGTMTSELLSDYEEGTWTPVLADAQTGGNTAASYSTQAGTYTKIGRQVSIVCRLSFPVTTGMTSGNNIFIRGLPFAASEQSYGSVYLRSITFPAGLTFVQTFLNPADSNTVRLNAQGSGVGEGYLAVSSINSGNSLILFEMSYFV